MIRFFAFIVAVLLAVPVIAQDCPDGQCPVPVVGPAVLSPGIETITMTWQSPVVTYQARRTPLRGVLQRSRARRAARCNRRCSRRVARLNR